MTRNQFCYAFLFVIAFLSFSCNKADDEMENEIENEMDPCVIIINGEFDGANDVFEIDLDQDSITDIEIIPEFYNSQVGLEQLTSVITTSSNWKLIGLKSSYHTCRDSFFSLSNNCLDSLFVYTGDCDSTGTNVQFVDVNIPISFSDLETNAQDSVETNRLSLFISRVHYFELLCDVQNGNFLYTWICSSIHYSYIEELEEFEILCKDTNGNFASIIIKNQEPYSSSNFNIDKIILCR